jgi:Lipopolysaccharide-assembly
MDKSGSCHSPFTIHHSPLVRLSLVTLISYRPFAVNNRTASVIKICRVALVVGLFVFASGFRGCYKAVRKSGLPEHIRTVAVPAFQNQALRYKIESRFTGAVINEITRRGKGLRVQSDPKGADAVVDGTIKSFAFYGVLLDTRGRARIFEVTITAAVTVRDQVTNRVLYDNQDYVFRGEFEFTDDPRSFFNEEDPAVERLARSFADSLVSTLVNGFGVNEEP